MGILETRVKEGNFEKTMKRKFSRWKGVANYASHYNGRIWVVWRDYDWDVLVVDQSSQAMHCKVTSRRNGDYFFFTIIYAMNDAMRRKELWNDLCSRITGSNERWIICGDFNVLNWDEQISKSAPNIREIDDFTDCVDSTDLVDLQATGAQFTWCNKREGLDRVYCKLDRAMCNGAWLLGRHTATAHFLTPGVSDHSPVVVHILFDLEKERKQFKFLNVWAEDEKFLQIVTRME